MFAFYLRYKKSALSLACVTPAPRVTAAVVGSSVGRPAIRIQSLDTRERALADKLTEGEADSGRILERETGFEPATLSLEG